MRREARPSRVRAATWMRGRAWWRERAGMRMSCQTWVAKDETARAPDEMKRPAMLQGLQEGQSERGPEIHDTLLRQSARAPQDAWSFFTSASVPMMAE